jgi:exodeoxyribonuclease VIII
MIELTKVGTAEHPLHFSDLSKIGRSPAHFRWHMLNGSEKTKPMRIGSIVHQEILGPPSGGAIRVFKGSRRSGPAWVAFEAANKDCEIVTSAEYAEANDVLESIKCDEIARPYLVGRHEVPLTFERDGVVFETRGIDVLGDGFITDLKTARAAFPASFYSEISRRCLHAQLRLYRDGAASLNMCAPDTACYLVAAETSPPWPVITVHVSEAWLDVGARILSKWIEAFKNCRAANEWPAYAQSVLEMPAPTEWGSDDDAEEDEEEEAAE